MKAIALRTGTTEVKLADRPEPQVKADDEVKVRILRVGICGTDREETRGGRALAPAGQSDLVIGHEMFGQVVEAGPAVTRVKAGDFAVFTVRRGCGKCTPCIMNRPDMCRTGEYRERGIWGLDGYETEFVVDREMYVVRVPQEIEKIAVLTEPLSIVEKAIAESIRVQTARLPDSGATPDWLFGRRCLVAGLGPVGLLAIMALRLRGARVYGLDIVDENSARPSWLRTIGGNYLDGRRISPEQIREDPGMFELIFEATGVAALEFNLLDALARNGVYVLTGIPGGDRVLQLKGAELIRQMVLENQVMLGSVNAARDHFQIAVNDLLGAQLRWGDHIAGLITHRYPPSDFESALGRHGQDEIKAVLEWAEPRLRAA